MTNVDRVHYLEQKIDKIERRFYDIDTLNGQNIATNLNITQFKEELNKIREEIKELKKELGEEFENIDNNFKDPDRGIFMQVKETRDKIQIIDTKIRALEMKFDTRIDKLVPDVQEIRQIIKLLTDISGSRLEKLEQTITSNQKTSATFERVLQAGIAALFSVIVALIKDCNQ